jgi:TRAP-type C4-dicarboxylate transport system permease small subunit
MGEKDRVDRAAALIAVLGACAILAISALVLVDVLMRWLVNAPVLAIDDLTDLNVAVAVVCCLPAGLIGKHLVTIRFLGRALGRKAELWLEVFGDVMTLAFFAVLAWQFAVFSAEAERSGLGSMVLQIPQAPWWWGVTVVFALCLPFQLVVIARSASRALGIGRAG